ncbi:sensor histidine kinase [Halomontanus rarus]|uniref:sensor histidine kinase n=1 Tax=Halomontanus rarus TaxID=3034020 RepID=UPI001A993DD5|nr:ATP-binding protein [Halovivax sp. TS33]
MQRVADDLQDDWVADIGEQLPVSPLSALGFVLATVIGVRVAARSVVGLALLESLFPFLAAAAVVVADRWLVENDVGVRDRITVFAYGLGGFLAAALVTALHVHVMNLHGTTVPQPLYLTLMSGTVGVAAGTIAGIYEIRQRAAVRDARRQSARLEEFASVVSHDLRNPLSVAQGRLRETFRTGDPDHLKSVDGALERMDELIEESLSVARNGTHVEESEEVPLVELASDAWESVDTDEARFETAGDRAIHVDYARAKNLFENLYRNAVEHGGDDVTVRVGPSKHGFFVEDDGPGIPAAQRSNVLEQGYSTGDDGSGLGLAIVRAIADAHSWDVTVTESRSGGARFEFTRG